MDVEITELLKASRTQERAGHLAEGMQLAEGALEIARTRHDREGISGGLVHIAVVHQRLGHNADAIRLATEALAFSRQSTNTARAYNVLGGCAVETHDLSRAEEMFRRCADVSRQIGFHEGLLLALHNLGGEVYLQRGQFNLALESELEAHRIGLEIESDIHFGLHLTRAFIYQLMGGRAEARAALAELQGFPHWRAQAVYYIISARLALDEDDVTAANEFLRSARAVAERVGHPQTDCWLRETLVRVSLREGNGAAARAWADDALAIARHSDYRLMEGELLIERAAAVWALGDWAAVESDLQSARELLTPLGAAYQVARATFLLAAFCYQQRRPEAESFWLDAARQITVGDYGFLLERERALAFPLVTHYARSRNVPVRAAALRLLERLARVPPLPLHIVGLGQFQVRQGHRRISESVWLHRKAGELFRFLLLQPRYNASRELVQESLWSGHSSSTQSLFNATSVLRRALEPDLPDKFPSRYLEVETERVTLHLPPGSTVDFEGFEQEVPLAISNKDLPALMRALDSYVNDLFPVDRYADWAVARRERLAQLYLRGLLVLAHNFLELKHPREALDVCRRLLAREPWQEEAVLVGMRVCLELNDRPGALRLYRDLETTLSKDLGISPRQDLKEFAASLKK